MKKNIVAIKQVKDNLDEQILELINSVELDKLIKPEHRIVIKPNFTYPFYKEGVTTSPAVIESLVKNLKNFSSNITICESNGGYFSWTAEDAFKGHNIYDITKKYGVKAINLSKVERSYLPVNIKGKEYKISFPKFLKDETDIFITMPVPKVHCMTGISLAMKNQWGCIPDTMRLSFHHIFNEAILEINKNLPNVFVIADGIFFLDDTGPMYGKTLRKDLIIASNDIGSFEMILCEIMGVDIDNILHLKYAKENGFLPKTIDNIKLDFDINSIKYQSKLFRSARNKIMYQCFKSKFLTYLFYTSGFGLFLHKIFYKVRETPEHLENIEQKL